DEDADHAAVLVLGGELLALRLQHAGEHARDDDVGTVRPGDAHVDVAAREVERRGARRELRLQLDRVTLVAARDHRLAVHLRARRGGQARGVWLRIEAAAHADLRDHRLVHDRRVRDDGGTYERQDARREVERRTVIDELVPGNVPGRDPGRHGRGDRKHDRAEYLVDAEVRQDGVTGGVERPAHIGAGHVQDHVTGVRAEGDVGQGRAQHREAPARRVDVDRELEAVDR